MSSEITKNKLAAQIIKAEMLGDAEKVSRLKEELKNLDNKPKTNSSDNQISQPSTARRLNEASPSFDHERRGYKESMKPPAQKKMDPRVQKFLKSNSSLSKMFVQEKSLTASDEARMYAKTAAKFSRDDMETKYFSEELDDSQLILNKSKRHKPELEVKGSAVDFTTNQAEQLEYCCICLDRVPKHLIIDNNLEYTYLCLMNSKPFLSDMSNVIIRNNDHSCDSFVSASYEHQAEVEKTIEALRNIWKSKGYRCIILETYFKTRKLRDSREFTSCDKHFQLHCLPILEKYFERARMCYRQSIQNCGNDWSLNKKIIHIDGRQVQRYLPKGLSYFWVCFDDLKNGYGHVIESEREFSRFFGIEVISGLLDKGFNSTKFNSNETFNEQFERSRDFKLMFSDSTVSSCD